MLISRRILNFNNGMETKRFSSHLCLDSERVLPLLFKGGCVYMWGGGVVKKG